MDLAWWALAGLVLLAILLFPFVFRAELQAGKELATQLTVRFYRFKLFTWKSTEEELPGVDPIAQVAPVQPSTTKTPAQPDILPGTKIDSKLERQNTAHSSPKPKSPTPSLALQKKKSPYRRWAIAFLQPGVETRIFHWVMASLKAAIRIIHLQLPTFLWVGMVNDAARTGQLIGILQAARPMFPHGANWQLLPDWESPNRWECKVELHADFTIARLVWFALVSFTLLIVLALRILWGYICARTEKDIAKWPEWRRWILNRFFPKGTVDAS